MPTGPRRAHAKEPGRATGNDSVASVAGSHPERRLFGQATPGPTPHPTTPDNNPGRDDQDRPSQEPPLNPLTQRGFDMRASRCLAKSLSARAELPILSCNGMHVIVF